MSFPRYQRYKDSGIGWLGDVPNHWSVSRLRFMATLNPSKREIGSSDPTTKISFLPMEAIGENGSLSLDATRSIGEVDSGYTYFREGDVAVAKITPCFENGKGAVMRQLLGGIGFGTTELFVARPRDGETTSDFLHWLFGSSAFRKLGEASMYGAGGQKRVPDEFVRDFLTAWPPLREQAAIATFLDRETAKIDALVAEQQRLIEMLKEKRQAVISQAVTKGLDPKVPMKESGVEWLGQIPAHWQTRTIAKASVKITNGYVGPTRDILVEAGVPYIQATHIKEGRINFDESYFVTSEWSSSHAKSILAEDDVLIVQTGAGTGDVGLVSANEVGYNCHALIIVTADRSLLCGSFLSAVLQSTYGQAKLSSVRTGAMHPHLNCGEVKFIEVPLPPLAEQIEIFAIIQNAANRFDALIAAATSAIELLQERRSALIAATVTGKIDVRGLGETGAPLPDVVAA